MSTKKTAKNTSTNLRKLSKKRSTMDDYIDAKWRQMLDGMPTYENDPLLIKHILEEAMPQSRNDLSQQVIEAIQVIEKEIEALCRYVRLCDRSDVTSTGQLDDDCIGWDADTHFPVICLIMKVVGKTESELRDLAISVSADIWRKRVVRDAWMSGLTKADTLELYLNLMKERGVPIDSNR
jgi:hypothetical protein